MIDSSHLSALADHGVLVAVIKSEKISEYESTVIQGDLAAAAKGMGFRVALDLAAVQMVSSVGLGMLISLNRQCKTGKGRLALFNMSPAVRQVFKISKLDSGLTIVADREAAIKAALA